MKRHELKIQRYDTFCDLCSEYHEYINCPLCDWEISMFYEGKVADCEERHSFSVWSRKWREKKTVIVECEHIFVGNFDKAQCGEDSKWELVARGDDVNLQCCEEGCPLLALSLAHFRESIATR